MRFHIYWAGSDKDGAIAGFYYAVVETIPVPPPGLGLIGWMRSRMGDIDRSGAASEVARQVSMSASASLNLPACT